MSSQTMNNSAKITPQMVERAMEALNHIWAPEVADGWVTSRDVVHCVLRAALGPAKPCVVQDRARRWSRA